MGLLLIVEMFRLDKVIYFLGERINLKCYGYEYRKYMERDI